MADRDVVLLPALPATAPLYAKALLPKKGGNTLPTTLVMARDVVQDVGKVDAYNRVCGFELTDAVPATWLHVLTFPLQLTLLADPGFPVPLAGVVHASNSMALYRPVDVTERLTLSCEASGASAHRRGVMIGLTARAMVGDELVWQGTSSYLALGAKGFGPAVGGTVASDQTTGSQSPSELPEVGVWQLAGNLGRQYAAVSGDVNPIHLNPLAAKAFGFPRAIIHGMWTHARILAALAPRLPESYAVDVRFAKPILLPSSVRFAAARTAHGFHAAVTSRDGATTFASAQLAG